MYDFKRVLVCLDLTEQDQNLIILGARLLNKNVAEKVYFFHAAEKLDLSDQFLEKYPDLMAPVDETIKRLMQDELDQYFDADTEKIEIKVTEGNAFDQILKWSRIKEIDLIMMGKKPKEIGSFHLPEKVVEFTHNSVLIVTSNKLDHVKKQLVPIDFSENSSMAIHQALKVREIIGAEIVCIYIYRVPSGYHSIGKSFEEFAEIMKSNAQKEYVQFADKNGLNPDDIPCIYTLSDGDHSKQILEIAHNENAELIVMGSKGRTQLSNLVLGSTAMKMVKYDFDIPLSIVKNKKENLSFLNAILKL